MAAVLLISTALVKPAIAADDPVNSDTPVLAQTAPAAGPSPGAGGGQGARSPSAPNAQPPAGSRNDFRRDPDPQMEGQDESEVPHGPGCRDSNEPLSLLV